jgi:fatty-acyl-CoA synthase
MDVNSNFIGNLQSTGKAMQVPLTPLRFKSRAISLYGSKLGVVCGDLRLTYSQFFERCDRLSRMLQLLRVPKGARVAYLAYNCHRLLEAYYGVVQMGAVLLPLNFRLSGDDLVYILQDAEPRVLFYDSDFLPLVSAIQAHVKNIEHFISLDGTVGEPWSNQRSYESLLEEASIGDFNAIEPMDEEDTAEIFYTSGTTATPKGVMLTHRNLYLHALNSIVSLGLRDTDVQLHSIPLFHVNGWGAPQSLTCMGGTHVLMRRFDPLSLFQLIEKEKVTYSSFVPTMVYALLQHPGIYDHDYSSLRMLLVGGAAPSTDMICRMEKAFGCPCYTGYGLTETSPILTLATPKSTVAPESGPDRIRRQSMTGWPVVGVDLKVVDAKGEQVCRDGRHIGEVIVQSDGLMKGYWNNPEETEMALREGWYLTGDMATIDEEGYIQIVDRKKDLIVSGGENIASLEIETYLCRHESVKECAVIAIPDAKWGEVPAAFIVVRENCAVTEEEILEFCRKGLASYKCPKTVEFIDSLPKGGTGKIQKRALRDRIL